MVPLLFQNSFRKSALFYFVLGTIGFFLFDNTFNSIWNDMIFIIVNSTLIAILSFYNRRLQLKVSFTELVSLKYGVEYLISFIWSLIMIDVLFDEHIYFTLQEGLSIYLTTFMVFQILLKINPLMFETYF